MCLAADATTIAIMRGEQLMFYRHRTAVDEEPLSALVHQTAMYHEDRLGGTRFARVWLAGASLAGGNAAQARREITDRLNVPAEAVDVRPAAGLPSQVSPLARHHGCARRAGGRAAARTAGGVRAGRC